MQSDIKIFKSSGQVYMRSWYWLLQCLFKVKKVFTDRLCHQFTTAPTQSKRYSKALQCPGIIQILWEEGACYIHVLRLQQQRHCSFLHHKSVDSINACINLIWTHKSFVRYCHIKEILWQRWNSSICHLTP